MDLACGYRYIGRVFQSPDEYLSMERIAYLKHKLTNLCKVRVVKVG
jgi:hypothetical protein